MLANGTNFAGYEIEGVLGHGGMGVVYEARQLSLSRKVALKILSGTLGMDPSFKERFRHEGRIQAAIDHPHIVTVYEAGEWEDSLFIAMRLVRGPNLKEMIIARELEGARTLRILTPIADALDSAHDAGLIHRDIKPQNILVGSRDSAYLADFGLTKGIDDAGLTRTGQFVGTIDYISPEQIRGEHTTRACDIYALAAVLYECLTGTIPYPKPSDAAVMYAHLSEPPPMVTEQRPELPPGLDDVICKAMAKDPNDRYQSAGLLIAEAERALGKRVRAVIRPPDPIEAPEEAGIREREAHVQTRPTRLRGTEPGPEETVANGAPAPAPAPAPAASAPAPAASAPATVAAPAVQQDAPEAAPSEPSRTADAPAALETVRSAAVAPSTPRDTPAPETTVSPAVFPPEQDTPAPATTVSPAIAPPTAISPAVTPSEERRQPTTAPDTESPAEPKPRRRRPPEPPAAPPPGRKPVEDWLEETPRRPEPVPVAPTPPQRREPARERGGFPLVAAALALVLAGVAGYFLGKPSDAKQAPAPASGPALSTAASTSTLGLKFPADWQRRGSVPDIPGLKLTDRLAMGPKGADDQGVLAGTTDATGPQLLPAAFVAALNEPPRAGDRVKLGKLEALRYEGLEADGLDGSLTVFAAPTSAGVATIACFTGAGAGSAFRPSCERVAGTLELKDATAFPLGPDKRYAAALSGVLTDLGKRRASARKALADARTGARQAQAARTLATSYAATRAALGKIEKSPEVGAIHDALGLALGNASSSYTALARAARGSDRAGYRRASGGVRNAEAAIQKQIAALKALGYSVG